jgi:hypothetical protein
MLSYKVLRYEFCSQLVESLVEDETYLSKICFIDETVYCLGRKVVIMFKCGEVTVLCTSLEHVRDSPKINVFFAMTCDKRYGLFFFVEQSVVLSAVTW